MIPRRGISPQIRPATRSGKSETFRLNELVLVEQLKADFLTAQRLIWLDIVGREKKTPTSRTATVSRVVIERAVLSWLQNNLADKGQLETSDSRFEEQAPRQK